MADERRRVVVESVDHAFAKQGVYREVQQEVNELDSKQ
jgi:hypothetical protein